MTALIDLDQELLANPEADQPATPAGVMSFRDWLAQWAPHNQVPFGAAVGSLFAAAVTMAALVIVALSADPQAGPSASTGRIVSHTFTAAIPDGAIAHKAVLYRTAQGDLILRDATADALIDDRVTSLTNVAAVVITVYSTDGVAGSCHLTVDGLTADQADADGDRPAICLWTASK